MQYFNFTGTALNASRIALGCMRISNMSQQEVDALIQESLDAGINFFDHADIYGGGKCEEVFGKALKLNNLRDKIIIQSKCGIRKGFFDFSKEYILSAVDGILKRLQIEQLDTLLLHRPDALMEPEEVAEAFALLSGSGKVKHFGVSNQNPLQMSLLQKFLNQRIIINQLQFSATNTTMIKAGLNVNMENEAAVNRDGGVLDYCRLKDITIQPWSPFQYGFFEGVFLGSDKFPQLNQKIDELSKKYGVTNSAMAIAWILRHPAMMQPVVGSTNSERIKQIARAADIVITREEWYEVYRAAGNILP